MKFETKEQVVAELKRRIDNASNAGGAIIRTSGATVVELQIDGVLADGMIRFMNTNNVRKPNGNKQAELDADVKDGSFVESWDPIMIGNDWTLDNGQHRCRMLARTGRSETFLVGIGVSAEAVTGHDRGALRTAKVTHGIDGDVDAACRLILRSLTGKRKNQLTRVERARLANDYAIDFQWFKSELSSCPIARGAWTLAAFVFAHANSGKDNQERIRALAEDLADCAELPSSKAIRRRLAEFKQSKGMHNESDRDHMFVAMVRAIQVYLLGGTVVELTPQGGALQWFCPSAKLWPERSAS